MIRRTQYLSRSVSVTAGSGANSKPDGLEHDVVGNEPGRRQVFLEQGRRHGERFARVVEAGLVRRVDGKFFGGPDVDSGQVVDRVVELGVRRAAGRAPVRGRPRFSAASRPSRAAIHSTTAPPLIGRRLVPGLCGRHLFGFEPITHEPPRSVFLDDRRNRGEAAQVELALRLLWAVAGEAVFLQEGPHELDRSPCRARAHCS